MDRKKTIKALAVLLLKRRQLFKRKLNLLILKYLSNAHFINSMSAIQINRMQQFAALPVTIGSSVWKIDRFGSFWELDVPKMSDTVWRDNFRVSKESFGKICEKVKSMTKQDTVMRPCIALEKRVAIALYALGSSSEYRTVAHLFGVGRTTVGKIVLEFCHVVCNNFTSCISSYPPTHEEINRIVDGFKHLGFPQCYGALGNIIYKILRKLKNKFYLIDGCHIELQPEKEEAVDYYNFKGWYSTILLAACDHRSKFTYINIGSAGKNNDSYIFERSSLKRCHETNDIFSENSVPMGNINVPVLLIGDWAFRLSRYMMKPFPFKNNQPIIEKNFNYRLSECRRVIENAFGQMKARFRKIGRGLEVAPHNCNVIIKACCLLHNFLKDEDDEVNSTWFEEAQATTQQIQPITTTTVGNNNEDGKTIRDAIALSFQNNDYVCDTDADAGLGLDYHADNE